MKDLKVVKVQAPVHIGDVVLKNVADTGVDVIATKEALQEYFYDRIRTANIKHQKKNPEASVLGTKQTSRRILIRCRHFDISWTWINGC